MPRGSPPGLSETDLYPPVHDFLAQQGYTVQGEVKKCDVAAVKGNELVVVELKLRLSWEAIAQAAERQQIADAVYVAVHKPAGLRTWRRRNARLLYLVRRLELGLLLVAPKARTGPKVSVEHPLRIFDRVKDGKPRAIVMREVQRRAGDLNVGGSVRTQILDTHRLTAIHIACCLERFGPLTVRQLQRLGTGLHTRSILAKSEQIEGWFVRADEGAYALKPESAAALVEHPEAAEHFRQLLKGKRRP
jgi:hypothetical protein